MTESQPGGGEDLLAVARGLAGRAGSTEQIEVYASRTRETEVKVHAGSVEALVVAERAGVGVRVLVGGRQGFAWAGSLDAGFTDEALAEARDNARFATPDEHAAIPAPNDCDHPVADLDLWRTDVLTTDTETKVELALAVEAATKAADDRVRAVESARYGDTAAEAAVVNSNGVEAWSRRTTCAVTSYAMVGSGADTRTGSGFSAARAVRDLDPGLAGRDAAERAVRLLGATQPPTRTMSVVFDPLVTRSLLAILGAALGAESVAKGRSMFTDRAGEEVAAAGVTFTDDPIAAGAFGATPFDSEGVPTRTVDLIDEGVLRGFLHNVSTASRAGTTTTGSAVRGGYATAPGAGARALALVPGRRSPDEILAIAGDALYVQSVSGLHSGTNPVSGDFSVGAEGLMVRGGALAEPVREVTIASTLPRMLLAISEVGNDLTWLPGGAAGVSLLVEEMTVSGS